MAELRPVKYRYTFALLEGLTRTHEVACALEKFSPYILKVLWVAEILTWFRITDLGDMSCSLKSKMSLH